MSLIKIIIAATLALASAFAFAAVDVNKANQAELESVKGVGPAMSGKILEARKSGAFKDWPDLAGRVKGIGSARAGKLSAEGLTVDGVAYSGPSNTAVRGSTRAAKPAKAAKAPATK